MSWINPSSKRTAREIDQIFSHEKSEAYFTLSPLDAAKQQKYTEVADSMQVYLQSKWVQHKTIASHEERLAKVRGNANDVLKRLKNPAASSLVSRATDAVMDQLSHRAINGIPLSSSTIPELGRHFTPQQALSQPALGAGNALARSASGSAFSANENANSVVGTAI